MAKKENTSVDCRNCKNGVKHGDHMVFCTILNVFRSYGLRICEMFK